MLIWLSRHFESSDGWVALTKLSHTVQSWAVQSLRNPFQPPVLLVAAERLEPLLQIDRKIVPLLHAPTRKCSSNPQDSWQEPGRDVPTALGCVMCWHDNALRTGLRWWQLGRLVAVPCQQTGPFCQDLVLDAMQILICIAQDNGSAAFHPLWRCQLPGAYLTVLDANECLHPYIHTYIRTCTHRHMHACMHAYIGTYTFEACTCIDQKGKANK